MGTADHADHFRRPSRNLSPRSASISAGRDPVRTCGYVDLLAHQIEADRWGFSCRNACNLFPASAAIERSEDLAQSVANVDHVWVLWIDCHFGPVETGLKIE